MPPALRAAQELDLLLQEGRTDNPALLTGLVHLYAPDLLRFAWEILPETETPIIRRLRARRAVTQALLTALAQIHRFQEQPGTFPWLLRLTYAHTPGLPPAEIPRLAATYHLAPEGVAYIFKIPERRAAALVELAPAPPPAEGDDPGSAARRAAFVPLTPAEATALIETLHTAQPAPVPLNPRFAREFGLLALALVFLIAFLRVVPNRVVYLPTPLPTATRTPIPPSVWEMTPAPLPTTNVPLPADVFYEPENPALVWRQTHVLQGPPTFYRTMAASPAGPLLAVGNNENQIILWDLTTFTITQTLGGHEGGVQSLAFSPDGKLLASGGGNGVVQLWEVPAGTLLQVFDGHPAIINGLAFSPDGQTLAVAAGKELWFWQVNSGAKVAVYDSFERALTDVVYSPDGELLAVSELNGTGWLVRVRDVFPLLALETQNYSVLYEGIRFSPDGQTLVLASFDNLPQVVRLNGDTDQLEGETLKTLMQTGENGYTPPVHDFAFSPNGRIAGVSVQGGTIFLYDTETWTPLQAPLQVYGYDDATHPVVFGHESTLLAVGHGEGKIAIWQVVDVSEEAAQLVMPRFYERLDRDLYRWTYAYTAEPTVFWEDYELADLPRLNEAAEFTIKIPMLGLLEGDHFFTNLTHDPENDVVFISVSANNQPGLLWGFSLQQRKVTSGEWLSPNTSLFASADKVGLTALVEPVQVGAFYGELVSGGWDYIDEENFQTWSDNPQQGDQLQVVNRWLTNPYNLSLRWAEGDILYTLQVYSDPFSLGPTATRDILLELALTMFDPTEIQIGWNTRPYFYKVGAGDTCASLAVRFYTTAAVIRQLNGLALSCPLTLGQTLVLPPPAEPLLTADLNCDQQEETVILLRDVLDPTVIAGVALDVATSPGVIERVLEVTAEAFGGPTLQRPELFSVGNTCEQFLAISGGTPTAMRTRVYRWDGVAAWPILDGQGRPYASDYSIAALLQNPNGPFIIPLIQYVPSTHPAAGPCPNEVTEFTWNGSRFEGGEMRLVLGECAGN